MSQELQTRASTVFHGRKLSDQGPTETQLRSRGMALSGHGQSRPFDSHAPDYAINTVRRMSSGYENASLDIEGDSASAVVRHQGSSSDESNDGSSEPRTPSPTSTTPSACKFRVTLERDALEWNDLTTKFGKQCLGRRISTSSRIAESAERSIHDFSPLAWFLNLFPILTWLRNYNVQEYLVSDIIVGFTVAILHIPQGMAYGLLAGVSPINGLYVSFFPVLVYILMGTSRHISIGTFAVVSIMIRATLTRLEALQNPHDAVTIGAAQLSLGTASTLEPFVPVRENWPPSPEEAITSICMVSGIMMVGMGFLHLGALSLILSDQLVSAFSCGAAVHVATSQFSNLFGFVVRSPKNGLFKLVHSWIDLFKRVTVETKVPTLIVSLIAMTVLILVKDVIEPRLKKRFKFTMPIPIDLVVIIAATAISYGIGLSINFAVDVMGEIPTGLPPPKVPRLDFLADIFPDCLALSIVSFAISLSLAKIYAKTHKYKVVPNQELLAIGTANIVSSFFGCYPCAASLSRSSVLERAGGKTQVSALVSCTLLLVVLLFLGPLLYHLPKCILAGVILVALKGMFLQVNDFFKSWKLSRFEAMTWLVTFLGVVLLGVDIGLIIGIFFSIFVVMIRFVIPSSTLLGQLLYTEIYVDATHFKGAKEINGIKIYQYSCSLFFMNRDHFKESLFQKTLSVSADDLLDMSSSAKSTFRVKRGVHTIILDCSTISYIDTAGVETIAEIVGTLKDLDIRCYLASCPTQVLTMFERTRVLENLCSNYSGLFPSVHDAVVHCYPATNSKNVRWTDGK